MSTSLWPALLGVLLGRGKQHLEADANADTTAAAFKSMYNPVHALLALTVMGEQAVYWWIGLLCFVALAYATNPSEASFKTHLTDLSFHLHLRRLRAHEQPESSSNSNSNLPQVNQQHSLPGDYKRSRSLSASTPTATSHVAPSSSSISAGAKITNSNNLNAASSKGKLANGTSTATTTTINVHSRSRTSSNNALKLAGGGAGGRKKTHSNGDSGRPHVLSFSNRVSISLKTPAYVRTSYALWSTVRILPASSTAGSNTSSTGKASASSAGPSSNGKSNGPNAGRVPPNGQIPVSRRSSTTLHNDKASSSNGSSNNKKGSSSSSNSSSSRKGGIVSTVAHGISASFSNPAFSPWLEQGGYFIGFLGYWWTLDDGTSFSGAREKLRLGNALLAVEEQDEDDDVSVDHQHGPDSARNADDLEGGHGFFDANAVRAEENSTTQISSNGTTAHNQGSVKRKNPASKTSQNAAASFRGGQRRSSPTPRQVSNKKRGSGSGVGSNVASQHASGDVTPVSALPSPAGQSSTPSSTPSLQSANARTTDREDLINNADDPNLPGLPFHVDRAQNSGAPATAATGQAQVGNDGHFTSSVHPVVKDAGSVEMILVDGVLVKSGDIMLKEGQQDGVSTISHSASAPEAAVANISPALALIQSQLDDLRTSSTATQARLEAEVEDLSSRKKDEDAVRTELKARTKLLEESKREAEIERLEAEKKLISARGTKKSVEDRVTKARSELTKLEKKEKEVQEKLVRSRAERRRKLDDLREEVKQREALLNKEEEATEKLTKRVAALEREIEERKNDLFQFRREEANAAAMAVTNRMNRAGRGLGPNATPASGPNAINTGSTAGGPAAAGNQPHGHHPAGPPPPNAVAPAKRHHMAPHGSTHASHRHPSQHPNAAVPVAFPYISPEEQQQQNQICSSSPTHAAQQAAPISDTASFGNSFMDQRMQSRRAASAAGTLVGAGGNIPSNVSSSMNTSVIGNSASAANALYNRQQLNQDNDEDEEVVDCGARSPNLVPGSTFAPFGPASPTSPSTIGGNSPREYQSSLLQSSPIAQHLPYFASDKLTVQAQTQAHQHRLRMSSSREEMLTSIRSEGVIGDAGETDGVTAMDMDVTPTMGLVSELRADPSAGGMSIAMPKRKTGNAGGVRRESFDSVGSFTSSNGGPLSPMTPHQASLIPSQLFDMLDDVEMPASPTPFQIAAGIEEPHYTFTQGISDAFEQQQIGTGDSTLGSGNADQLGYGYGSKYQGEQRRSSIGMYSPWADFDMDAGFDFDKPLGFGNAGGNGNGVSRRVSGRDALSRHASDAARRRSGSPLQTVLDGPASTAGPGEGVFASYGTGGHGHQNSVGSIGQRSNTSSSGGSVSPSLAAAAAQAQAAALAAGNNPFAGGLNANLPANAFGKMSPNDLLFDKARHALSLNPDAKAFSFNRPLPSSASAGSLTSIGGGANGKTGGNQLPSNAVGAIGDPRQAFDAAITGIGNESPTLGNSGAAGASAINTTNGTWASPNLGNRGLHGNLGYGGVATSAGLRESTGRSASGPPSTGVTGSGNHTFSPFDDDDLLKGW